MNIMETSQEYFARPDTPAAGSPVGVMMVRVLEKNPGMSFEAARAEAKALLERSARARVYRLPRPLSPEEQAAQRARLAAAFGKTPQDAAVVFVPSSNPSLINGQPGASAASGQSTTVETQVPPGVEALVSLALRSGQVGACQAQFLKIIVQTF